MQGLINSAPSATFHLCFDNDMAGRQFDKNFRAIASKLSEKEGRDIKIVREEPSEGYKDFNDELLGKKQHSFNNHVAPSFDDENEVRHTVGKTHELEENENETHHGFRR